MLHALQTSQAQANSDSLTGLLTRRSLETRIREVHDSGQPYVVAYGDLDHFKNLNDSFGHDAGDRALRCFAQVLRDNLRPSDVACRYGGEEFVILLPSCDIDDAVLVLERVRAGLASHLAGGRVPSVTVSFGVSSSENLDSFEQVVNEADGALFEAKAAGRDQIVVAHRSRDTPTPAPARGDFPSLRSLRDAAVLSTVGGPGPEIERDVGEGP